MTREVLNHLRDLDENLTDWEFYLRQTGEAEFLRDRKTRHALLHCVLVALQAAIDIGDHWVTELTPQRPESYRAIMELLEEKKAVPAGLARELKGLFSLRNVLIHKYQELDLKRLYAHIERAPKFLKAFLRLAKSKVKRGPA